MFYEATGGSRWRNSRGWMSAAPLNEWEGVTVDASGRVTKLLLEAINLSGITILTSSDASYWYMNAGNIPAELSQLSSLQWLTLRDNNLSGNQWRAGSNDDNMNAGNILAELSQLRSLRMLSLSNNNLSGNGYLWCSCCNDDNINAGNIPAELSLLSTLLMLDLSNNNLLGNQWRHLWCCC